MTISTPRKAYWIPIGIGVFAFFVICGPAVLNPLQDTWLLTGGDLTQQYFGWAFFRNSPWTIPLGLMPSYGMDISSSIVYSDGNPLLSLLFKPFNAWLPATFQFQGIWLLFCFVMQGYIAYQILSIYTQDQLARVLGSSLFLLSMPMLFRVGVHTNLAAHFLILGGLYLNLRPWKENQGRWWAILLIVSLGVHFYLFAMVFALWIADLGDRIFIQKITSLRSALQSFFVLIALIVFCAWQFGYFTVKAPSLFGYGFFKANLLSPLNPNGWSYFIKDLPIKSSWGEGNLYLGIGALLLLALGLAQAGIVRTGLVKAGSDKTRPVRADIPSQFKQKKYLLLILILLALFSITHQIGIGSFEFRVPLPQWLLHAFGVLRHSARLFWPVFYAILIAACVLVLHHYKTTSARIILACCLALQMIDLSPGLIKLHAELNTPSKNDLTATPLRQPFWELASKHYNNVYVLPSRANPHPDFMARFMSADWKIFGRYAHLHHLNTNAVYLSRYDLQKQEAAFTNSVKQVEAGQYDPKTLYIIKNEDVILVALGLKDRQSLFAKIDGFNVLAPNFLNAVNLEAIGQLSKIDLQTILPALHHTISFKRPATELSTYALTKGWNNREDWGTWSGEQNVVLTLPLPHKKPQSLTLTLRAFVNGAIPQQLVRVSSEGKELGQFTLTQFENNTISLQVPENAKQKDYLSLEMNIPNAASPASIGMDAADTRILGIGIVAAQFD